MTTVFPTIPSGVPLPLERDKRFNGHPIHLIIKPSQLAKVSKRSSRRDYSEERLKKEP